MIISKGYFSVAYSGNVIFLTCGNFNFFLRFRKAARKVQERRMKDTTRTKKEVIRTQPCMLGMSIDEENDYGAC